LKFLIGRHCPVSAVVIDESLDVLLENAEVDRYSLLLREHPQTLGRELVVVLQSLFSERAVAANLLRGQTP
jgi:hypothetical protein